MSNAYLYILGCLFLAGLSGCATSQPTASIPSERAPMAYMIPLNDHSHDMTLVGWTLQLPSDMP